MLRIDIESYQYSQVFLVLFPWFSAHPRFQTYALIDNGIWQILPNLYSHSICKHSSCQISFQGFLWLMGGWKEYFPNMWFSFLNRSKLIVEWIVADCWEEWLSSIFGIWVTKQISATFQRSIVVFWNDTMIWVTNFCLENHYFHVVLCNCILNRRNVCWIFLLQDHITSLYELRRSNSSKYVLNIKLYSPAERTFSMGYW